MIHKKTFSYRAFFLILQVLLSSFFLLWLISGCSDGGANTGTGEITSASQDSGPAGPVLPQYSSFVNDYTGTLSAEWLAKTEELTKNVEQLTSSEIGVAIIDSLGGITIEDYAAQLFEEWGIGKKEKDNGVLLLVSMMDRELRIETGYGLEPAITDLEAKEIIDEVIVPAFKQEDYGTGIFNGVAAIANIIYQEEETGTPQVAYEEIPPPKRPFTETWGFPFIIVFANFAPWLAIGLVMLSITLRSYIKEYKCPKCKKIGLKIYRKWLVYPTYEYPGRQEVTITCKYCDFYEKKTVTVAKKIRASTYGSSGGFSSGSHSGSSSSGSHSSSSFGGGSSGGGGASGSW